MSRFEMFLIGFVASIAVAGLSLLIYVDAKRTGVDRPVLWAGVVFATTGGALAAYFFTPVPIPGVLVLGAIGVVFYAFERDDHLHGDEPSDPHLLPGGDERTASEPSESNPSSVAGEDDSPTETDQTDGSIDS